VKAGSSRRSPEVVACSRGCSRPARGPSLGRHNPLQAGNRDSTEHHAGGHEVRTNAKLQVHAPKLHTPGVAGTRLLGKARKTKPESCVSSLTPNGRRTRQLLVGLMVKRIRTAPTRIELELCDHSPIIEYWSKGEKEGWFRTGLSWLLGTDSNRTGLGATYCSASRQKSALWVPAATEQGGGASHREGRA
jgi:hypothetical protein